MTDEYTLTHELTETTPTDNTAVLTLRIEAQLSGPREQIAPLAPHLAGAIMTILYPHGER